MNPIMCEFDEGKPHEMPAEYMVSKRNEEGRFNREQALCEDHFIDYALSMFRWEAIYGNKQILVCNSHKREKDDELEIIGTAPPNCICYFCRGGQ